MHFHEVTLQTIITLNNQQKEEENQKKLSSFKKIIQNFIFWKNNSEEPVKIKYLIQDTVITKKDVELILRENKKRKGDTHTFSKNNPLLKYIKKYDPKIQLILKADYKFPSILYRIFKREDEW